MRYDTDIRVFEDNFKSLKNKHFLTFFSPNSRYQIHIAIYEDKVLEFYKPDNVPTGFEEKMSLKVKIPRVGCLKLTTSLVIVSLKFKTLILQIHCYLLLEK